MWIDEKGVAHTVALPNPTDVMAVDFRTSLDALVVAHHDALQEVVEDAEMSTYDMDCSDLAGSEVHVGAPPPVDLLRGTVASPEDVRHAIEQVVPRWRLDAIMALDDYLDD